LILKHQEGHQNLQVHGCTFAIIEIDGKLHDFGVLVNNGFELGHEKHVLEGLPVSI
jgi:hypothetical protein